MAKALDDQHRTTDTDRVGLTNRQNRDEKHGDGLMGRVIKTAG